MNETGSTSKKGSSFKDVTRESQRQIIAIPRQSKSAMNQDDSTKKNQTPVKVQSQRQLRPISVGSKRAKICFETMRGSTSGCVNQRQAGPSTNAYAVSPSSQAGPSKALQRLSSPPPALRYRRSKDDDALRNKRQSQTHSGVNQRQAGPSTNAYAVSPSSKAGPSKAASFATRGNLSFTERAELQRPPPTRRSLWTDTNVQRYAAPSPQANAVYPSTQAGPSKAANANALKNKNLQASQQPTQAYPNRRSKYDDALRNKRQSQTHSGVTIPLMERDLCPREKVSKARRLFKIIFKELLVDVEAKRTTRIDHDVRMMLKEQNMCVNTDYRVGDVPGILVGDEFEYKTEMSVVGLHFGIMSGIDCQEMSTGLIFATSIVASEGSQYRNVFKGDQLLYSGVGKGLLKGNMALVNSMKHKAPVRVIRGIIHHGNKQMFVYLGLYLVKSYERGAEGCFQFLLETA